MVTGKSNLTGFRRWAGTGLIALTVWSSPGMITQGRLASWPAIAAELVNWNFNPTTQQLEFGLPPEITPRYFLLAEPARIVVDLPNTQLGNVPLEQTYGGAVQQIRVSQFDANSTRIVLELAPGTILAPEQAQLSRVESGSHNRWVLQPLLQGNIATSADPTIATATPPAAAVPIPVTAPETSVPSLPTLTSSSPASSPPPIAPAGSQDVSALPSPEDLPLPTDGRVAPADVPDPPALSADGVSTSAASLLAPSQTTVTATALPIENQSGSIRSGDPSQVTVPPLTDGTPSATPTVSVPPLDATTVTAAPPSSATRTPALAAPPSGTPGTVAASAPEAVPPPQAVEPSATSQPSPPIEANSESDQTLVTAAPSPAGGRPAPTATLPLEPPGGVDEPPPETVTADPEQNQAPIERPLPAVTGQPSDQKPGTPHPPFLEGTLPSDPSPPGMAPVSDLALQSGTAIPSAPALPAAEVPPASSSGRSMEPVPFGQPLPSASTPVATQPSMATAPGAVAFNPYASSLIPRGTLMLLQYPNGEPLVFTGTGGRQEVLLLSEDLYHPGTGERIAPSGTVVTGRFEFRETGPQFITQAMRIDGQMVPLQAESEVLVVNRDVNGNTLLVGSGVGAIALTVLGGFTGVGLLGGVALGAATSYATTPEQVTIQPAQMIQVQVMEDVPRLPGG